MSFLGQDEQIREFQFRFKYLYFALVSAFILLISRIWYLQIISGDTFRRYSEENRIKSVKIKSPRGMIFDRNKKLIIDNRPAYDLEITPEELYSNKEWKTTIERLAKILNMKSDEILDILDAAKGQPRFLPIKIKQDLSKEELAVIESHKLDLPGANIQVDIKRTNLYQDLASHLMGYIGEVNPTELPRLNKIIGQDGILYKMGDVTGKSGLEARWESTLRGIDGEDYMEVDAFGHRRKASESIAGELKDKQSIPGKNIILTIDQDLQVAALEAFKKLFGDKKIGAVIALNPKTGEILASVSQPSFDPTEFSRGISSQRWNELLNNEFHPLRDKTIQDHYSPGSTFKAITAIAGLEEGAIDINSTVSCTGGYKFGNRTYGCWKKTGHGTVNVVQALAQSCDVFFYKLGQKIGIDMIAKYAKMLGLGTKTGINLAHEEVGLVPTEAWKKQRFNQEWNPGETLSNAIGQSYMLTTPLQLANAYAAIGSGALYRPHVVKYIESVDGRILKEYQPEHITKVTLSKKTLDIVHQGLFNVVNDPHGTTYSNRIPGLDVAGKTGTTQVIGLPQGKGKNIKCENMPFIQRDNGLFAAFAPADDPVIAVAVVTEHSCHGATGAAPIAMQIIKAYLQKANPQKYGEEVLKAAKSTAPKKRIIEVEQEVEVDD